MHCHAAGPWGHVLVPSAVLAASLLGSGHCALMCGGLVAAAARSPRQQVFYHAGRLIGYVALGWISGWLGSNAILHLPSGVSEGIAILIGLSFVVLGIAGWRSGWHLTIPGSDLLNRGVIALFRKMTLPEHASQTVYSGLVGLLSIFLPCGWLYGFVLASLSVADPVKGVYLMFCFWLGTVPALIVSPLILRKIFSAVGNFAPRLAALLLIAAGLLPILFRYVQF